MKSILIKLMVIPLILLAAVCSNDDEDTIFDSDLSPSQIAELRAIAAEGSWRIIYYLDTDKEETSDYNGYTFTFGSDGSLTASNGTNEIVGTWSITDSDNSNDDSNDEESDVDFNISFSAPPNFEELSDDWDVAFYSSTRIELIDVSGGNGGTDNLFFEKN